MGLFQGITIECQDRESALQILQYFEKISHFNNEIRISHFGVFPASKFYQELEVSKEFWESLHYFGMSSYWGRLDIKSDTEYGYLIYAALLSMDIDFNWAIVAIELPDYMADSIYYHPDIDEITRKGYQEIQKFIINEWIHENGFIINTKMLHLLHDSAIKKVEETYIKFKKGYLWTPYYGEIDKVLTKTRKVILSVSWDCRNKEYRVNKHFLTQSTIEKVSHIKKTKIRSRGTKKDFLLYRGRCIV
jgi:Fe-S cluster biosynthesis and repair protein YggX